jgi:hypothetical protein
LQAELAESHTAQPSDFSNLISTQKTLLSFSVIFLMIATAGERGMIAAFDSLQYQVALLFVESSLHTSAIFAAIDYNSAYLFHVMTNITTVTFKMTIDRMVPYRFVVIQLIFMASMLIYSIISWLKQGYSVSFGTK